MKSLTTILASMASVLVLASCTGSSGARPILEDVLGPEPSATSSLVRLVAPERVGVDDVFPVDLVIDAREDDLAAYAFSFGWDPTRLEVVEVVGGDSVLGSPTAVNLSPGSLRINGLKVGAGARGRQHVATLRCRGLTFGSVRIAERRQVGDTLSVYDAGGHTTHEVAGWRVAPVTVEVR
jgi:hypothetical protein